MSILGIANITIDQLPIIEDDHIEFKSSLTKSQVLGDKIQKAASGFANSGGGLFVVGLDDKTGMADGGILRQVGNTPLQDCVDMMIGQVEPPPKYSVKFLEDVGERGFLKEAHVLLLIAVEESNMGPHMAPKDKCYYIRAGAHTVPARHFIVEAIRSKRFNSKPKLSHLFRIKPGPEQVLQLGIIALTNAPALEVTISLSRLPGLLKNRAQYFPVRLPVVDQNNPFYFDIAPFAGSVELFGNDIILSLEYYDLQQNHYIDKVPISLDSTPPLIIGNADKQMLEAFNGIKKALDGIEKALLKLNSDSA